MLSVIVEAHKEIQNAAEVQVYCHAAEVQKFTAPRVQDFASTQV